MQTVLNCDRAACQTRKERGLWVDAAHFVASPREVSAHVASHVKPGSILVITSIHLLRECPPGAAACGSLLQNVATLPQVAVVLISNVARNLLPAAVAAATAAATIVAVPPPDVQLRRQLLEKVVLPRLPLQAPCGEIASKLATV